MSGCVGYRPYPNSLESVLHSLPTSLLLAGLLKVGMNERKEGKGGGKKRGGEDRSRKILQMILASDLPQVLPPSPGESWSCGQPGLSVEGHSLDLLLAPDGCGSSVLTALSLCLSAIS